MTLIITLNGSRVSGYLMSEKLEVPRRKVRKDWHVGLNPDPANRSHPDVHDDLLIQEATAAVNLSARMYYSYLALSLF